MTSTWTGRLADAAETIDRSGPHFERLAPVPLSIVCFRYLREGDAAGVEDSDGQRRRDALAEVNRLNRELMVAVHTGGDAYLSNTMIGDAFALRA
jgi:aromatic-L-amino-acid/L-tryptophan decarboxylase